MPVPSSRWICFGPGSWGAEMAASSRDSASSHFVAKWLAREPEMAFAEVFCPEGDRPRFRAWGALLHELREALFELSDPTVSRAKCGWWAEELLGLGRGQAQHPLTLQLIETKAPWSTLARALVEQEQDAPRAADTREAISLLLPLAQAVIQVESAVFGANANPDAASALAAHWLLQRLPAGLGKPDQARLPMHLLARHGMDTASLSDHLANALLRDWASELSLAAPTQAAGSPWLRRSRLAFDRVRLRKLASGSALRPLSPLPSLWTAWRAARAS